MKTFSLIFFATILFLNSYSQEFVSPINFIQNESNKDKVVLFIKSNVKKDYSKIGMDDPLTLRMMEKENLEAFKKLTKAENIGLLESVITNYCKIGMCNYVTINMMYNEQNAASKKSLSW